MMNFKSSFVFLFSSLAITVGLQLLLPFPYGLVLALGVMIAMPIIVRKVLINKMGENWGRFSGTQEVTMSKVCTVCGSKSKGRECSRCGSHQFRMK